MIGPRMRGDAGAMLIIVLIIVTVISTVMGVIFSQVDTSVRTTVVLRDQASDVYAADAAGQAAVTQLADGKLSCAEAAGGQLILGSAGTPFYQPVSTVDGPLNASATCLPDTSDGVVTTTIGSGVDINNSNDPTYALLTVGTSTASGEGQNYAGNKVVCMNGGSVRSNANINLNGQGSGNKLSVGVNSSPTDCTVQADPSVTVSAAAALGCNGSATDNAANDFSPTACTHANATVPKSEWSTYAPVPTAPITRINPPALCHKNKSTTYAALLPGLYTNEPGSTTEMNVENPCGTTKNGKTTYSSADFVWLTPGTGSGGTYYFSYGSTSWDWPETLISGTPVNSAGKVITSLVGFDASDTSAANEAKLTALSAVQTFPGACASPATMYDAAGNPVTDSAGNTMPGTELVFGGASTFTPSSSGNNEVCATYSVSAPPVAIYGVSYDISGATLTVSGGSIPAETLCAAPPCTSGSTGGASLVGTDPNGQNSFYVQGFTFAPSAPLTLTFKNSGGQVFGWGLLARSFQITVNGTSSTAPFVVVRPTIHQGFTTTTTYTLKYINVWTCVASSSPCPQSGPPDLRAKVRLLDDGSLTVLSWSHTH